MVNENVVDEMGAIARRTLHVIIMADTSGSMAGDKIQSLNQAARTVLQELQDAAAKHTQADLMLRVIDFSSGAQWESVDSKPVSDYQWTDLSASGVTDLGAAIDLLTDALDPAKLGEYQYPPVVALLSDGAPTDNWEGALQRFEQSAYGRKRDRTVRSAIAIGRDADKEVLARFTGNRETVVEARTPAELVKFLRWATVTMSSAVSQGRSRAVVPTDPVDAAEKPIAPTPLPDVVDEDGDDDLF